MVANALANQAPSLSECAPKVPTFIESTISPEVVHITSDTVGDLESVSIRETPPQCAILIDF